MPDVHCAYRYKGGPCSVPPQDVRLIVLGNGDQLEVLLCTQPNRKATMTLTALQLATITAIAAAVIPLFVSLLKREPWATWVKQAIAGAVSFVAAAVGIAVTTTNWSAVNIATIVALSYTGSQVVYQAYFRGSAFDTTLTKVGAPKPPAAA